MTFDLHSVTDAHVGAVTAIRRASSHLALNIHFHSFVTDGIFLREEPDGPLVFRELPPPTDEEIADVASETCRRVRDILVRAGRWLEEETDVEDPLAEKSPGLADLYQASVMSAPFACSWNSSRVFQEQSLSPRIGAEINAGTAPTHDPRLRERWHPSCHLVAGNREAGIAGPAKLERRREGMFHIKNLMGHRATTVFLGLALCVSSPGARAQDDGVDDPELAAVTASPAEPDSQAGPVEAIGEDAAPLQEPGTEVEAAEAAVDPGEDPGTGEGIESTGPAPDLDDDPGTEPAAGTDEDLATLESLEAFEAADGTNEDPATREGPVEDPEVESEPGPLGTEEPAGEDSASTGEEVARLQNSQLTRPVTAGFLPDLSGALPGREESQLISDKKSLAGGSGDVEAVFEKNGRVGDLNWLLQYEKDYAPNASSYYRETMSSPDRKDIDGVKKWYDEQVKKNPAWDAQQRAKCLMQAVHDRYAGSNEHYKVEKNDKDAFKYVCRHHARLMYEAGKELGIDVDVRASGWGTSSHVYNYVTIDGRTFISDGFVQMLGEFKK